MAVTEAAPILRRLSGKRGSSERLVFVSGFHTSDYRDESLRGWVRAFRRAGWRGSVHWLWWDSFNSHRRFCRLWDALEWAGANRKARRAGELMPRVLRGVGGTGGLTLVGHSLGAKVIFEALLALPEENDLPLKNVIFLAGAVHADRDDDWAAAARRISGALCNVVNERDGVLGTRYFVGELLRLSPGRACGRIGAPSPDSSGSVINLDVTELLDSDSHTSVYKDRLQDILGWMWRSRRRLTWALAATAAALAAAAALIIWV